MLGPNLRGSGFSTLSAVGPNPGPATLESRLNFDVAQRMSMQPSPTLVAYAELLALSTVALENRIDQELDENPALDVLESPICPGCGLPLGASRCAFCDRIPRSSASYEMEGSDPLERVPHRPTMADRLLEQARWVLPSRDLAIAEHIVGNLDDRGFLDLSPAEVGLQLGVGPGRVDGVLAALRDVGPAGIAASDVRESLLLQVDRLTVRGQAPPLARPLVDEHLDAIARGDFAAIARSLGVSEEEVIEAREFIRDSLTPFPVSEDREVWERPLVEPPLTPDLIVVWVPESKEFDVEVVERRRLRVDPLYQSLTVGRPPLPPVGGRLLAHRSDILSDEHQGIRSFVRRAQYFTDRLMERSRTLQFVGRHVVRHQADFLRWGPKHLAPMTRSQVAAAIGLHESTVSRAVAGKYVQLPSGQVVLFSSLFDASLAVREVLRELIASEDHAMSDEELRSQLEVRGYRIARRTVAKYRHRLGMPACPARRFSDPSHPDQVNVGRRRRSFPSTGEALRSNHSSPSRPR